MPRFALRFDPVEFETGPGVRLPALRPAVTASVDGAQIQPYCFFDTGAPLSVVSSPVARYLNYQPVPLSDPIPRFVRGVPAGNVPAREFLTWDGLPCVLAELAARFRDVRTGQVSQPVRWVAKVLQVPSRLYNDNFVILGMQLLADNAGTLHIDTQPWGLAGYLELP